MIFKNLAALLRQHKRIVLYGDPEELQWVGDGAAVYPLHGMPGMVEEDLQAVFDVQEGETEGFVNLPLGIAQVRLSLFLKEDEGHFRVSIRSKAGVSASRLAAEAFHGGGHECAAGGKLYFPQDIPSQAAAGDYLATVTARFMRNPAPSVKEQQV